MTNTLKSQAHASDAAISWLIRLESPDLNAEKEAEFFHWLDADVSHQVAFLKAKQLWQRGSVLNQVTVQPSIFDKLRSYTTWQPVALAFSLVIAFTFYYLPQDKDFRESFNTPLGEQRQIALADGSSISLNTATEIEVVFSQDKRVVHLNKGEAYFEVAHAPERPFYVHVGSGVVRVVGTRFNVRNSAGSNLVTVTEGKVSLASTLDDNGDISADVLLTANQQLSLEDAYAGIPAKRVDAKAISAWKEKQLIYREVDLEAMVKDLNRYFDTKFTILDPELKKRKVFASIQLSDFKTTLKIVEASLDLKSEIIPEKNIVILLEK